MQLHPDKTWTLFLDRDGVINIEKVDDYIHHWGEFVFYENAVETVARLSQLFGRVIVVTNQKGIGKGVTREEDVHVIHQNILKQVQDAGGHIEAFYFCPDTANDSPCRKPNAGMAFKAKQDYPDIDFDKSLMVGNNLSDMQFGRNAGMHTAFLRTTQPDLVLPEGMADMEASDLSALLRLLTN
jgi:D-glycero-D-manno-heptose 1,7-bisphosphate phosphatase